jgi:glutamate synthase (NADPH/NADH) large chain
LPPACRGGVAYVYDVDGMFAKRCNMSMVTLEKVLPEAEQADDGTRHRGRSDEAQLKQMIEDHARLSGSERAQEILADWARPVASSSRSSPTNIAVR